jgi:hypothetical protein
MDFPKYMKQITALRTNDSALVYVIECIFQGNIKRYRHYHLNNPHKRIMVANEYNFVEPTPEELNKVMLEYY